MTQPTLAGTRLVGGYWLERLLGAGRFGSVYEATHEEAGRVAIKCLHREADAGPDFLARFQREASLCQTLVSPHIVNVYGHAVDPVVGPFLVMRLLRGSDLGGWLARHGPIAPRAAVAIARQICEGLKVAHKRGVVHRDLKPENVFLDDSGAGELTAVVCDFGLAKICDEAGTKTAAGLTTTGAILGTPYYMAPEQVLDAKRVDARADVWAVGMILYHALTGKPALSHLRSFPDLVRALALRADGRSGDVAAAIAPLAQVAPDLPPGLAAVVDLTLERFEKRPTVEALERSLWAVYPSAPNVRAVELVRS